MGFILLSIWLSCLNLQVICFKFGYRVINEPPEFEDSEEIAEVNENHNGDAFVTLVCLILFIAMIINPYDCLRNGRV